MAQDFKYSFKTPGHSELSLTVYNVGFQKCPPGYGWGPGVRDHYLLHYILSGRGTYRAGGAEHRPGPGDLFLIVPDEPAEYQADGADPWEYYWVGFAGPAAPLLLAQTPFAGRPGTYAPAAGDAMRQALLDIYKARGSSYPHAVRMAGYLQAALGLLMEGEGAGEGSLVSPAARGADFFRRNYSQPIGVEDAARHAGVSRSSLYRAFEMDFGCSPSEYLTRCRLSRARQLLSHSALSVSQVAASVGFDDPLYFSRVFKRETGLSPSAFRENGGR